MGADRSAGAKNSHVMRRVGSPADPGTASIPVSLTSHANGLPPTAPVRSCCTCGHISAARAASSAEDNSESPSVSIAERSCCVGISALSMTVSSWTPSGVSVRPL